MVALTQNSTNRCRGPYLFATVLGLFLLVLLVLLSSLLCVFLLLLMFSVNEDPRKSTEGSDERSKSSEILAFGDKPDSPNDYGHSDNEAQYWPYSLS